MDPLNNQTPTPAPQAPVTPEPTIVNNVPAKPAGSIAPTVAVFVIILILVVAGLSYMANKDGQTAQTPGDAAMNANGNQPGTVTTTSTTTTTTEISSSDDVSTIESELNATTIDENDEEAIDQQFLAE
jgi:hypothetical protein